MTKSTKGLKVEFAPGCFDDFEGTQEELDSVIEEIQRMAETGELIENSRELTINEIDDWSDEDEDYQIIIDKLIEPDDKKRKLH